MCIFLALITPMVLAKNVKDIAIIGIDPELVFPNGGLSI